MRKKNTQLTGAPAVVMRKAKPGYSQCGERPLNRMFRQFRSEGMSGKSGLSDLAET